MSAAYPGRRELCKDNELLVLKSEDHNGRRRKSHDLFDFMFQISRDMASEYERIQKEQQRTLVRLVIKERKIEQLC